jgi:hypothetical protein
MFAGLLSIVLGFPGTFIILADVIVYSWITKFDKIGFKIIIVLLILSLLAETADFFLGMMGARKYGSSKKGVVASIIGGIVGAILLTPYLFGLGIVIGAFLGSFAGVFIVEYMERKNMKPALRAGYGAMIGRVAGTLLKGCFAVSMIIITMMAIYS